MSAKIAEELAYEKEAVIAEEPEFLKEFKAAGIWTVYCFLFFFLFVRVEVTDLVFSLSQLEDTPGNDEVTLHRKFGNEK